jgi:parallel beta-helix repeat protein
MLTSRVRSVYSGLVLLTALFAATLLAGAPSASAQTVIYVNAAATGANNGTSWADAYQTVQPALTAAPAGTQVWVAAGRYVERITLKEGVALYGGLAGTEDPSTFDLATRNLAAHQTILDGNRAGSVVTAPTGATAACRIDGFTITNGRAPYGGGFYLNGSSPTIANNTISGNTANSNGGALYLRSSSPAVIGNNISQNTASSSGAALYVSSSSAPAITNNTISGNTTSSDGGGIHVSSSSTARITENTIAANRASSGAGLYVLSASPTIANNTVLANSATTAGGGLTLLNATAIVANNAFLGNSAESGSALYVSYSAATLVNNTLANNYSYASGGALQLNWASPTIANTIVALNSSGLCASGTSSPTLRNNCIHGNASYDYAGFADPTGTDGNISIDPGLAFTGDGRWHLMPDSPCRDAGNSADAYGNTDLDAQPRIQPPGGAVDIGADESDGASPESPGIVRVSPLGNDAQDGSSWPLAKRTVRAAIDAVARAGGEVWVQAGTYAERIELTPFVHVYGGFAGTESALVQRDWKTRVTTLDGQQQGSVVTATCPGYLVSTLDGFTVTNGKAADGGGLYLHASSPTLANNIILANTATNNGAGLCLTNHASPLVVNSTILANRATNNGGGLYVYYSAPRLANCTITANSATYGGAAYLSSAFPIVANTTITGNNATRGGAFYLASSTPTVANTIIAFNASGLYTLDNAPILRNNCVYGNTAYNFSGFADPTGTSGNIAADPALPNWKCGDSHILPDSPCVDAGNNTDAYGPLDIDDQPRIQPTGGTVDIGADESDGTVPSAFPIVRVSPTGADNHDGSSWPLAKRTVQAALQATAASGGEVWVQAGTYYEHITLPLFVHLYGGFAGTETARDQRNWHANVTTLDAQWQHSVVTATHPGHLVSTVDGFTITRGNWAYGGGLNLASSSVVMNNAITGNVATYRGGGIHVDTGAFAIIANNRITANSAPDGGAVSMASAYGVISGNTIVSNGASGNGGALYLTSSYPTVANSIIAFNSSGIYNAYGSIARYSNCIYGNTAYNYSGLSDATGTNGNISVDPGLTGWMYGGWHLAADSPCIDAGQNAGICGLVDLDGEPRIQPAGGTVDIGADESDGSAPAWPFLVVRVSPLGDDAWDGSSWDQAKRTVQAAVGAAAPVGGEVWVQAGTYFERFTLLPGVHLYGGFAGTESTREQRDWRSNITTLDGQQQGTVVTGGPGYLTSTLDGFTVTHGKADDGGGLNLSSASPAVANNTITANTAFSGGGLHLNNSAALITNNTIASNSATYQGGGFSLFSSAPRITGNLIAVNSARNTGGALYLYMSASTIVNNTIVGNSAASSGGGLCLFYSSPLIANTLVAFNSSGIRGDDGIPTLRNNCVFGNMAYNFSGLTDPTGTSGNISADPLFIQNPDPNTPGSIGDLHLQPASPCINAGNNADVWGTTDLNGFTRIVGGIVDMGAYEYHLLGDLNGDGFVDAADLALFTNCLTGPNLAYPQGCGPSDLDTDTDVDFADFARLQALAN